MTEFDWVFTGYLLGVYRACMCMTESRRSFSLGCSTTSLCQIPLWAWAAATPLLLTTTRGNSMAMGMDSYRQWQERRRDLRQQGRRHQRRQDNALSAAVRMYCTMTPIRMATASTTITHRWGLRAHPWRLTRQLTTRMSQRGPSPAPPHTTTRSSTH